MDAAELPVRHLAAVFLTHHHMDHNAELGPILLSWWLFGRAEALPVRGPLGTTELVDGLVAANAPTVAASFTTGDTPPKPAFASVVEARNVPRDLDEPVLVYEDAASRAFTTAPSALPGISTASSQASPETRARNFRHISWWRATMSKASWSSMSR